VHQAQLLEQPEQQLVVVEHPSSSVLEVTGADALEWLQSMLTADVLDTSVPARRSLCLDRLGKIQAEVLLWRAVSGVRLVVVGGDRQLLIEHFQRYIIMEDVEVRNVDDKLYSFHGPKAAWAEQFSDLEGSWVESASWLTKADVIVLVPPRHEEELRERVVLGGFGIEGLAAWDQLRVVWGLANFGTDYHGGDTPGTAGLVEETVSRSKGCYLGQEVVCTMLMRGSVREQAVRLRFDALPSVGVEIRLAAGHETIGRITSVGFGTGQSAWAIGRVKTSALESRAAVVSDGISGQICPRAVG
jgi:tRNA-modifying protein YgfZ